MTLAALYARVSSERQKEDQTIASQTAALVEHAAASGLEVPAEWIFEDEGYSGATLVRPGLERLRDLAAQVEVEVILCYSPDRLARKYAYQALLMEEFARVGTEVRFVKGPKADTPEDELLLQFQGMIAEYERYPDIGITLVMPTAPLCRLQDVFPCGGGRITSLSRHNHSPSRKASRASVGR
jgi:site-specific DNA recombinase